MSFKRSVIICSAVLISTSVAFAKSSLPHASDAENPRLATMQCKEFLAYKPDYRPMIVYWASAYVKGGSASNAVLDIEETEQLIPVVVAECEKMPKASFWQVVKAKYRKINS